MRASYIHNKSFKRLYHPKQCYYYTTVATSSNKDVVNSGVPTSFKQTCLFSKQVLKKTSEDAAPENSTQISPSTLNP